MWIWAWFDGFSAVKRFVESRRLQAAKDLVNPFSGAFGEFA